MFINASPDSRSLDMVDLRYVFNLLSVLNERSHSADVIGNVHKMRSFDFLDGGPVSLHGSTLPLSLLCRRSVSSVLGLQFHQYNRC